MAMAEERLRILKLLESGKINSEEAAELLTALSDDSGQNSRAVNTEGPGRAMRVTVKEHNKTKVNINLPLSLVDFALSMCQRFVPHSANGVDLDEVRQQIRTGLKGRILEVQDDEDEVIIEVV